jgi:hypothetical protein
MKFNFINILPKAVGLYIVLLFLASCGAQQMIRESDLIKKYNQESLDNFGAFIWFRNKNGIIVMNTYNLDIIKNNGIKKSIYFKTLNRYLIFFVETKYNPKNNISFSERSYIVAHIVNSLYEFRKKLPEDHKFKDNEFALDIIFSDSIQRYHNEFIKKEYYGLIEFKEKYIKQYKENPPVIKKDATTIINTIE